MAVARQRGMGDGGSREEVQVKRQIPGTCRELGQTRFDILGKDESFGSEPFYEMRNVEDGLDKVSALRDQVA